MNLSEFLTKHRDDVRAGRYTAARQWSIAEAIIAEKGEDA